jgi:hypothetical protein
MRRLLVAARGQAHLSQLLVIRDVRARCLEPFALNPCASPFNRAVENIRQRLIDDAEDCATLNGKSDLHSKISVARDEAARAVKRVNHPDSPFAQTPFRINRLFSQDAIIRKLARERADDQLVGGFVGLRDRLGIFLRVNLALNLQRRIVVAENGRARLARQSERNLQFVLVYLAFRFHVSLRAIK